MVTVICSVYKKIKIKEGHACVTGAFAIREHKQRDDGKKCVMSYQQGYVQQPSPEFQKREQNKGYAIQFLFLGHSPV